MQQQEQAEFLKSLGLSPTAPGLVEFETPEIETEAPAKPKASKKNAFPADAHTMKIMDIPWNPAWLDQFPNLDGPNMAEASRYLFAQFKSEHRDKDRHSLLHREIGLFITRVRAARRAGSERPVTDQIKAEKPQRDMAAALAAAGVTPEEVQEWLRSRD